MNTPLLGCVADDYTGATDVAAGLRRAGLRTVLLFGPPADDAELPSCDAAVVGLKTRTAPAGEAVRRSTHALAWLREHGAGVAYFKYCSTFDSTDDGNIGPVADALLAATGSPLAFVTPASPEHGRTVYQGHLFVGDALLSDSPMRHHPLTPMTDANLVRVLGRQTTAPVRLLPLATVRGGVAAVSAAVRRAEADGVRYLVTDVVDEPDLRTLALAGDALPFQTGGAGLGRHLGAVLAAAAGRDRDRDAGRDIEDLHPASGPGLVLAGSCSAVTLEQVAYARERMPAHRIDPAETPDPGELRHRALAWLDGRRGTGTTMVYSSAGPADRARATAALGDRTAEILEGILADVARHAVDTGTRRIVVAGGETSGAVVDRLGVGAVVVAAEEDHGVPWCVTTSEPNLFLLLKSGNFGRPDLLVRGATRATGAGS